MHEAADWHAGSVKELVVDLISVSLSNDLHAQTDTDMSSAYDAPKKKRVAVLVLKKDGVILRRLVASHRRITIGRKADSDLVIDAPAVSSEHAVINRTPDQFFYEDLDSTNGSHINGERVDYGMLYDGDVIQLGDYSIEFLMQDATQTGWREPAGLDQPAKPVDLRRVPIPLADIEPASKPTALIRMLNGLSAGKEWVLDKPLTTIGYPPRHVAVLMTLKDGYAFANVEGDALTMINGLRVTSSQLLVEGDMLKMGDVEAVFLFDPWYRHRT